jgi:intracellular septation protein
VELPGPVWTRLTLAWIVFFLALGFANLYVAYSFTTEAWANFKVFGATGLIVLFVLGQGVYMSKHLPHESETPAEETKP